LRAWGEASRIGGCEMLDFIFDFLIDSLTLLPFLLKRRREITKEWFGTVEEKARAVRALLPRYRYTVVFRTEEGQRKKLRMGRADFDLYQEGRRYAKKAGDYLPDPHSAI
jgi:hypothetical protein